ncbi:MAG: substrate-binding domain-containing protein [Actinobacteria bacterium]|nr:substrate-binding domain-containing protein [Actinomycetota bacterium]
MKTMRLLALAAALALLLMPVALLGCGGGSTVILAATSDLEGSGILQEWAEDFQARSGNRVDLVIVPDDEAFAMARHGECDIILTHNTSEQGALESPGYIQNVQEIMRDDFVLVGPPDDPAGVREAENISDALKRIADSGQTFILRIDGSGNAYRQNLLWSYSGVSEAGGWLLPTEAGAGESLQETSLEEAYTLPDRSSFERMAGGLDLEILFEGDESMANPYYGAAVSTLTYPDTNLAGALEFIDYLLSEDARRFFGLGVWEAPAPVEE